jgi:hypothetical protein
MRWETAEPPGANDAQGSPGGGGQEPQEQSGEERLGPIAFTRELKDDGRMLLLYRRRDAPRDG